jgi:hypothetical protein
MKTYPTISRDIIKGKPFYCFDKLDGSNIRAEWDRKKFFWKFGTRHRLLDETDQILGKSINLIKSHYEKNLHDIFIKERQTNVVCFFEFFGENSFAGNHNETDDHKVLLIDVSFYKKGILDPREFIKLFSNVETANLLYNGNVNEPFILDVKNGSLKDMTFEGVVCKSILSNKKPPVMFKIKNNAWIQKLKTFCNGNEILFNELL